MNTNIDKDEKSFTSRDWISALIIISIIQAFIWYVSFVNAKNGSALTYISFAGTLISIILAVLAIGYTYGESLGQKNKSDTISNQINTLNEVIRNVQAQTSSLDKISEINSELLHLSEVFTDGISNTHKKVDEVKSSFDKFLQESRQYSSNKEEIPNTIDKATLAKLLLSARSPLLEIAILSIYAIRNERGKHPFSITMSTEIPGLLKEHDESIKRLILGTAFGVSDIFRGAGLLEINEKATTFSKEFEYEILNNLIPKPKETGALYTKIRDGLIQKITSQNQ